MSDQPGLIVEMSDGRKGRTFHKIGKIGGKYAVYPVLKFNGETPIYFSSNPILCREENLKVIGFID